MGEIEEPELGWIAEESQAETPTAAAYIPDRDRSKPKTSWALMLVYASLILAGQSSATLLGRLYYNDGGNTALLQALLENVGSPMLIPFALILLLKNPSGDDGARLSSDNLMVRGGVYVFLGVSQAGSSVLYSIGLKNLPVSTFALINTSQLGFNAFFAVLLNAQKVTPPILNSLFLVTISSILLVFHNSSRSNADGDVKRKHFATGFSCTLIASALSSLTMSMTQLAFNRVFKRQNFYTVLNLIVCQELVATSVVAILLFVTGEWRDLSNETENFELGKDVYVTVLASIAVSWQMFSVGAVGLIVEVSSLFSNVISTVGLPVVPILAAVFFHESLDAIKVISMVLAVWGFGSYVYHHYLNECKIEIAGESRVVVEKSCMAKSFISQGSQYN
ncbi:purine permease 21-like [Andrographis paniculata]|uniref:purine permease 21-like n=1 Tax=Andrographis paniculata TaxID=175694 RepID=UPI0021E7269F|nr:purine permease 21-like [Andrographis paniculata]